MPARNPLLPKVVLLATSLALPVIQAQARGEDAQEAEDGPGAEEEAQAEGPGEEPAEDLEIIVFGELELQRRRMQLEKDLSALGYRAPLRREGKSIYRPETQWKPSYVVHDSGHVELRRTPPRFEPWVDGRTDNKWRYLSCLPPFTPMCVRASGWLVSKRRLQHSKTALVEKTYPSVLHWQEAVAELATEQRLHEDIPDLLEDIWEHGKGWRKDENLETMAQRRTSLAEFLGSRNCTPEGQAAREVVLQFIEVEVQDSEAPFSEAEMEEVARSAICPGSLDDPSSSD